MRDCVISHLLLPPPDLASRSGDSLINFSPSRTKGGGQGKFSRNQTQVLSAADMRKPKKIFFPFAKKEVETDLSVTDVSLSPSRARDKFSSSALLMQMASNTLPPSFHRSLAGVWKGLSLSTHPPPFSPSCLFLLLLSESHKGRGGEPPMKRRNKKGGRAGIRQ